MKKIFITFIFLLTLSASAADKIKVEALSDFTSVNPSETIRVRIAEDAEMAGIFMIKGDIINCSTLRVTDPKRAKRNAKIFFSLDSYVDSKGSHNFKRNLTGKYAKTVISKDNIKDIDAKKAAKSTAGMVGNHFIPGVSYGISFVDGVVENQEGNRLKSGAKQVYKDSFLSYVEYGEEIEIKEGDEFYLIVKAKD